MCPDSVPWLPLIASFFAGLLVFFAVLKLFGPRGVIILFIVLAAAAIPAAVDLQQTLAACK